MSSWHEKTATLIAETLEAIRDEAPDVIEFEAINDVQWTEEALRTCYNRNLRQMAWIRGWANRNLATDETLSEARTRLQSAKTSLVSDNDNGTLLLVTSAIPIQLLVEDTVGTAVKKTQLSAYNTGILEFEWKRDESELIQLNAIPHLSEHLVTRGYFVDST